MSPTICPYPVGWLPYIVQYGDTLNKIAIRHRMSSSVLQQANCLLTTELLPGIVIYVPPVATQVSIPCGPPSTWIIYYVRLGDTLSRLSQAYQVSVGALQAANCMGSSTFLRVGQALYVPPWRPIYPPPPPPVYPIPTMTNTPVITPPDPPTEAPTLTATQPPVSPTDTAIPPTDSPAPPTDSPAPPTATTAPPTDPPAPPTATTAPPTDSPPPPTESPVPTASDLTLGLPRILWSPPPLDRVSGFAGSFLHLFSSRNHAPVQRSHRLDYLAGLLPRYYWSQ